MRTDGISIVPSLAIQARHSLYRHFPYSQPLEDKTLKVSIYSPCREAYPETFRVLPQNRMIAIIDDNYSSKVILWEDRQ